VQQHHELDSSAFKAELTVAGSSLSRKLKPEDKTDLQHIVGSIMFAAITKTHSQHNTGIAQQR
jgi:hypothetical protein